jgi:hypothetical protein
MTDCQLFWKCGADKLKQPSEPNAAEERRVKMLELLTEQITHIEKELKSPEEIISKARGLAEALRKKIKKGRETRDTLNQDIADLSKTESRHVGTSESLLESLRQQHDARKNISTASRKRNEADDRLKAIRERKVDLQGERSQIFDQIIKRLVNDQHSGSLNFAAVETRAILHRDGVLESEAFKALRCVAYDFTALVAGLNGVGHHPGFLLHDSPRESDMEPSLYRPIFELIAELESRAPDSFQYIVTTTEHPPSVLRGDDFVRARLSSASAIDRLYGANL